MSLFRLSLLLAAFLLTGCASTCLVGVKRPYADPEGTVPRMVFLPEVPNLRDLGGWRTVGGKVVRQGMIYRSGRLNERWRWYRVGPARDILSDETRRFLVEDLGIRTEIDLRKEVNCRGMVESPLGPSVKFVNIPAKSDRFHVSLPRAFDIACFASSSLISLSRFSRSLRFFL